MHFNLAVLMLVGALTVGCGQDDIKVYTVPKETPPTMAQAGLPAGHPDISAPPAASQLQWKLPEGWKESPPGDMRVASFRVKGSTGKEADVSVIPLPGAAGGDLSNVNRWRDQVSQPPVSADELKKLAQPVEVAGQSAMLYEQNGEGPRGDPTRILAVIQNRNGTAWFFKMTGDDQLVAQQKATFVEFLKSFRFAAGAAPAGGPAMTGGGLPAGHPDISGAPAGPISTEGKPQWIVPAGWKEVAGGQFLVAKFVIAGEGNAQAAVNVSSSAGDGGGLAANVNRWRKQLGLNELPADELAKSTKTSGPVTFVEMTGTDARTGQPAGLVAAIVPHSGQTWFYKLMGDAKIVTAQRDAFTKFVQDVKY